VAVFGAAALWEVGQAEAEAALDLALRRGVNHIDVAPSYGQAETRLAPWLARNRASVFLGCKTMERSRNGAWDELQRSLKTLGVRTLDLYQAHAVREMEELDQILAPGGAIEAFLEARERGLVRHLGITGHGHRAPVVHAAALERFDFETVMTPLNFVQWADEEFRAAAQRLLALAAEKDVGVMVIKAFTRAPWGDRPHTHNTWYEPFVEPGDLERCLRWALSQRVTALTTPGDLRLLPAVLDAAAQFEPLSQDESDRLVATAGDFAPLFS
jgi:aryl-alcohol dehydrogenase-like predicted oxidoreductase